MCGIVGYIGNKNATPILIEGLKKLEYRGYDSAGIAVLLNNKIHKAKSLGKLAKLEEILKLAPIIGNPGIGHTRWATHGRPSDRNAHPHSDCKKNLTVVHNGIIENYLSLREKLIKGGHKFRSETDTEVIAHLIEEYYNDTTLEAALQKALKQIKGSYAIGIISKKEPQKLIAARHDSPLIIGINKGEKFIASDIPAFLNHTRTALLLRDGEIAVIKKDSVKILDREGKAAKRKSFHVLWDAKQASKSGYKHFMLKEIFEQPKVVLETLSGRLIAGKQIYLDGINLTSAQLKKIKKIFIVACGTAYHAGLIGKYLIEEIAKIPVEADLSSEFRYRNPILDSNTLFIAVSQSGETADTLAAIREAKKAKVKTLAICNVIGSSLTREAKNTLYTRAGIEIGVAATKTFTAQLAALYLLAFWLAQERGGKIEEGYLKEIYKIPKYIDFILKSHQTIKDWTGKFYRSFNFLYLGRGINYPIALEGALKLKEISYIHAEGYAAGEMKHGPIALIDRHVPVVALATQGKTYEKIISNIKEVKARQATVLAIATRSDKDLQKNIKEIYYIPKTLQLFYPILNVIPLQLLAYYISEKRGCDVDQPRNLAKSVTVE